MITAFGLVYLFLLLSHCFFALSSSCTVQPRIFTYIASSSRASHDHHYKHYRTSILYTLLSSKLRDEYTKTDYLYNLSGY
jgi:hypothetical protein